MPRINISISQEVYNAIAARAERTGVTFSSLAALYLFEACEENGSLGMKPSQAQQELREARGRMKTLQIAEAKQAKSAREDVAL